MVRSDDKKLRKRKHATCAHPQGRVRGCARPCLAHDNSLRS
jgi:hypothetical protein